MELKHIKELMAAMRRTATKKLSLKKEGFELVLEAEETGNVKNFEFGALGDMSEESPMNVDMERQRANMPPLMRVENHQSMATGYPHAPSPANNKEDITSSYVTSPMVGTFFLSPSPEDPPFTVVGSKIEKNSLVCIIEAMKVMNEVKAGVAGTVAEVLVENGHPVEFGTKLFRVI